MLLPCAPECCRNGGSAIRGPGVRRGGIQFEFLGRVLVTTRRTIRRAGLTLPIERSNPLNGVQLSNVPHWCQQYNFALGACQRLCRALMFKPLGIKAKSLDNPPTYGDVYAH